jgi:hypothetical protein
MSLDNDLVVPYGPARSPARGWGKGTKRMRFASAATIVMASSVVLTWQASAHAHTWVKENLSVIGPHVGTAGVNYPAAIQFESTAHPTLGENMMPIAPYYPGTSNDLNLYVIDNTPCTMGRCNSATGGQAWSLFGGQWYSTDTYLWGLNVAAYGYYIYGWGYHDVIYASPIGSAVTTWPDYSSSMISSASGVTNVAMVSGSPASAEDNAHGWGALLDPSGLPSATYLSSIWQPTVGPTFSAYSPAAGTTCGVVWAEIAEVALDSYAELNDPTAHDVNPDFIITLSTSGVVQHYAIQTECPVGTAAYWVKQINYPTAVENPTTGSCTSGNGTLFAVQVAYKNGVAYALGGIGSYTGGPGTVYWYDSTSCWKPVGSATDPSSPLASATSITTDNSEYYYNGTPGPYVVWATDRTNTVYAACNGSSCPTPF